MTPTIWTPPVGPHLWIRRPSGLILPPLPMVPYPLLLAPALVGGTQVASKSVAGASTTQAMPGNVTSGNILLTVVSCDNATANTPTVSRSSGTATLGASSIVGVRANTRAAGAGAGSATANVYLLANSVTGSGSLTVTVAVTGVGGMGLCVMEWSGLSTTLDGSAPAPAQSIVATPTTSNTIAANNVVTTGANSLVCGFSTCDAGGSTWTFSASGAWSIQGTGGITGEPAVFVYQVANAGTLAPTFVLSGSSGSAGDACIGALALQAATATVTPPRPTIVNQAVQRAAVR